MTHAVTIRCFAIKIAELSCAVQSPLRWGFNIGVLNIYNETPFSKPVGKQSYTERVGYPLEASFA